MIGDAIAGVLGKVIDRAWPDPTQRAAASRALLELQQAGEFKEIDAELERSRQQTEVNKIEAASDSVFKGGWRPFIGWICGVAFAWHFVGRPIANWIILVSGTDTLVPEVEIGDLLVVLLGMLGLGGLRTAEKFKGVAAK